MKISELRAKSFEKYKKHRINSWILSLICGLFIAAIALICIVSQALVIIFIPIVILPFFFACVLSHAALSQQDELSWRNLFGFYRLFFRPPFYSSFSAIKSALKALLAEFILGFIAAGIIYAVYSRSETFIVTINQVFEAFSDMSITNEQLQALLEANNNEFGNFLDLTNSVSFLLFAFSFIFFILREEITIYVRATVKNIPLANQIARASIKANAKNFNKYYFALNWPLLVIFIAGMVGGCFLSIYAFNSYALCGAIGLSLSLALSSLFLPFYFSNQETIFEQLAIDINSISEEYVKGVFEKYGVKVEITEHNTNEEVKGVKKDSDDTEPS